MPLLPRVNSLWRNLLHKEQVDRELAEEIRAHIDLLTQTKIEQGLTPEAARRAALVELGGVEQVKESVREVRQGRLLEDLWQDTRYAARSLRKHPAFTTVAILTLALGIGANTAIFSVINAVLLRPLPYHDADELAMFYFTDARGEQEWIYTPAAYLDLKNQTSVFTDVAAWGNATWPANLTGDGEPER